MSNNKFKAAQSVTNRAIEAVEHLTEAAAKDGIDLVAKVSVVPASNFPDWPTKLAEALCENPKLASQPNRALTSAIENRSGKTGFNAKLISKDLTNGQLAFVSEVFRRYGYSTATLKKGTDIKRIVREQIRDIIPAANEATVFFPDGVAIDGKTYKYRKRNTEPRGLPWYDLCIRIAGIEVPLEIVLKLRGVGIGEFQLKDEAAQKFARSEQTVRRRELDREPQVARSVSELAKAVRENHRKAVVPGEYTGSQLGELIRAWFYNVTVEQGRYVCLGDLLKSMEDNAAIVEALEALVSQPYGDAANDEEVEAA
ncbi:conserved hypothetical protein [Burkholderia sp. 8Y]|uniref:hypothetical protein n=1 Tax=Burkholderia sp. 8Y TaxID=2653133 RepID=UPI0012F2F2D5|nr:hypothetical protein [Burkholderia sp. 8Y]VXC45330.1 conserved hypothetical protein [Burkholderia sp. 8Y]